MQSVAEPDIVKDRRVGIGGTDIAAILGVSPYRSAWDVWAEKVGELADIDRPQTEVMYWGKAMEPLLATEYTKRTQRRITWLDKTFAHPERAWHIGRPDAICMDEERGVDCKTASAWLADQWGPDGSNIVPDHYAIQAQWYMSLFSVPLWDFAVLIGGNDFRVVTVEFDPEIEVIMLATAEQFWRHHVIAKDPPVITASEAASMWLARRYPRNNGTIRPAVGEEGAMLTFRGYWARQRKECEKALADIDVQIKAAIADADGIETPEYRATFTARKDGTRVLRFTDKTSKED